MLSLYECCRSVTHTSASSRDVQHYSHDQFESAADKTTTNGLQSSGKQRSSTASLQKVIATPNDEMTNVPRNKDRQRSIDEDPTRSHRQSGN